MKLLRYLTLLLFLVTTAAQAQTVTITGRATDQKTNEPLAGVTILLRGTNLGASTGADGTFSLKTDRQPPLVLVASFVGFARQEITVTDPTQPLTIALAEDAVTLTEDVVVSASRVPEDIRKAAVTVEKLGARQFANSPAANPFDALQNLKGVDLLTQSLTFKSVNVRGFGANNNNRFVQLTDGMDNRSPGLGFGFGSVAGVSDLDIESIELIPGAASALYGPDALQGLMLTTSKNPFVYQGLSAQVKVGMNNVGKTNFGPKGYSDLAIRYAKTFGRFAFKVNFQRLSGTDFIADNYDDRSHRDRAAFLVDQPNRTVSLGYVPNNNPATNLQYDGVNIYGDDFNNGGAFDYTATNTTNAALVGKRVTRTGYTELDLLANQGKIFSNRANVSLHYKLTDKIEASVGWYYGGGNFIRTAGFREYFPDYQRNQFRAEVKGEDFFVRAYSTSQTAEGYNLGNLARRLLQIGKPTATWASDFAKAYTGDILAAKQAADAGIFLPGSADYTRYRDELINTPNNVAIPSAATVANAKGLNGVRLLDNSSMYHAEGMYNFRKLLPKAVELITGASFRHYSMLTQGTIFPTKKDGSEFAFNEYGWYLQGSLNLKLGLNATLKPTAAVRYDKNEFFKGGFTPRVSGVLSVGPHNFRASWQSAFRNPSPNQLLSDGKTGEVGGSQAALEAANLIANPAYTPASVAAYQKSGNATDLVKYTPDPAAFTTEKIKTWEVGYKTLIKNRLYVDAFLYRSIYTDFIAAQNYLQPTSGNVADLKNASTTTSYQVNFNNTNEIFVNGWGLGLEYGLGRGFTVSGNYARQVGLITRRDNFGVIQNDAFGNPIVERRMSDLDVAFRGRNFFISPENRYNVSLANPRLTNRLGANITYRWTDQMWVEQGTTAGDILLPSWSTVDAQISYKLPALKTQAKLGATNLLNQYYAQGYGLARIGGLYYLSLTFDELFR
ncbi:TonB-dependent receptor [Fibrella sp. HMF5335]|uniref:TonB-dependent receptor n=1 Tax=Fibrella rubiginis TaxID=2817060 RepID=A0A939GJV0_9BACT|nr:TonB-dependent receptor [Fibrella rubiginis]MBO0938115.1 TonB-dependent receptor [Fibrella rubiginis]